jgi:transcriptional regulator with XRE-family HTH domain
MDIVALRTDLKLTQTEFAHQLGVSPGYIGDLERGRREVSLTLAAKIEQTFKLPGVVAAVVAEKTGQAA